MDLLDFLRHFFFEFVKQHPVFFVYLDAVEHDLTCFDSLEFDSKVVSLIFKVIEVYIVDQQDELVPLRFEKQSELDNYTINFDLELNRVHHRVVNFLPLDDHSLVLAHLEDQVAHLIFVKHFGYDASATVCQIEGRSPDGARARIFLLVPADLVGVDAEGDLGSVHTLLPHLKLLLCLNV